MAVEHGRSVLSIGLLGLVGVGKAWVERSAAGAFLPVLFQTLGDAGGEDRRPFLRNGDVLLRLEGKDERGGGEQRRWCTISKRSS